MEHRKKIDKLLQNITTFMTEQYNTYFYVVSKCMSFFLSDEMWLPLHRFCTKCWQPVFVREYVDFFTLHIINKSPTAAKYFLIFQCNFEKFNGRLMPGL